MRVCQLCAVDFTLEKFLTPLIDGFEDAGHGIVSVCSDGAAVPRLRNRGYEIYPVAISRSFNLAKHVVAIWRLYRYFRQQQFDLVHVHTPIAALVARIAAYFAKVPYVVYTAHGFYFHDDMPPLKRNLHVSLERFAGKMTDLLFTQSQEDAETAVIEGIMSKDKVFAIGNGVDVSRFVPQVPNLRAELGIPDSAFVVGMIGRLVEEKGVVEFLRAAISLAQRHEHVYFMLVGGRLASDHSSSVDEVIKDAKSEIGDRLVLTGLRDDIPALLSSMDVFCLPSWREGMPRTIIEAMMMGKPVVATNIRGSREEVVDGQTGLLVPVRSPEGLATAINAMISDPLSAEKMGEAGRQRALDLYDERKVVELQLTLIEQFAPRQN